MVITAVVDRIENGNAILISDDMGIEISIPVDTINSTCLKGELLSLVMGDKLEILRNEE